eukprot:3628379-Amphidinium_carterae.1
MAAAALERDRERDRHSSCAMLSGREWRERGREKDLHSIVVYGLAQILGFDSLELAPALARIAPTKCLSCLPSHARWRMTRSPRRKSQRGNHRRSLLEVFWLLAVRRDGSCESASVALAVSLPAAADLLH